MRKSLAQILILSSSLALSTAAEPELKGTPGELAQYLSSLPKTVSITGEAEIRVPADQVVVTLKVVTDSKSMQEGMRLNQERRAKVLALLKDRGLPPDRVHASRFSSTPRFGMFGEKAKSYRIEHLIRAIVQDEREFEAAAGAVDSSSEVQFVSADFEVKDKKQAEEKALSQACDDANKRKAVLEEKLGVRLTAIGFSSGGVSMAQNSVNKRYAMGGYAASAKMSDGISSSRASESGTAGLPLAEGDLSSIGELVFTTRVSVEYSVHSK